MPSSKSGGDDMERNFPAEVAEIEARLSTERDVVVVRLRTVREAWARATLGVDQGENLVIAVRAAVLQGITSARAAEGLEQLAAAEAHQWEIGSWSSGAGEGLSSMREVRELQLAQAWLWAVRAQDDPHAVAKARELLRQVEEDPNRVAAQYSPQIRALYERLGRT